MSNRKKASKLVGILKTFGFFAFIILVIGVVIYISGSRADAPKFERSGYKYLDINDLGAFDYYTPIPGMKPSPEQLAVNKIPEDILALNGSKVTITGFMMPVHVDDEGRVTEMALNGNYDRCFYGVPSQINQWVHVKMQPGAYAAFSHSPIVVSGTLEVGELVEDGEVISIYRLSGESASTARRSMF